MISDAVATVAEDDASTAAHIDFGETTDDSSTEKNGVEHSSFCPIGIPNVIQTVENVIDVPTICGHCGEKEHNLCAHLRRLDIHFGSSNALSLQLRAEQAACRASASS